MSDEPYGVAYNIAEVYADLGGIPEIAEALGVSVHRVKRWIDRRASTNCPRPVRVLKGNCVYSINDWRGWFAIWRITRGSETWRRKGDPPKPKVKAKPKPFGGFF